MKAAIAVATLMMLSSASEYSATLPVSFQARNLSPSTTTPTAMLPRARRWIAACGIEAGRPLVIEGARGNDRATVSIACRPRPCRRSTGGLAELLAQPVVEQLLVVAQRVVVGRARTAVQVGQVGELARTLREDLAVGAGQGEVQGDARRVDVAHVAHVVGAHALPGLEVAGALDVGDRHVETLAFGQVRGRALAQVLGQRPHPVAAPRFPAVAALADLGELRRVGPLHVHRTFGRQAARDIR